MKLVALITVVLAGLFLIGLGAMALVTPVRARRFLSGFAASAQAHYLEMLLRLVAGAAFIVHGPKMLGGDLFTLLGWLLVLTTAGLLLLPWRWHQRFARRVVPPALRFLPLFGLVSAAFGALVLAATLMGYA
ncbi:MAG TPA: hypothetical protein VGE47_15020 [Burkholderiaceae bacterium]